MTVRLAVLVTVISFFALIVSSYRLKTGANLANNRYFHSYLIINKKVRTCNDLDFRKTTAIFSDKSSVSNKDDHRLNVLTNDTNNGDSNAVVNGFLLLNAVAVLWGSQHVVIKSALSDYPSTSLLNLWRFAISSLLFIQPISRILTTTLSTPGSANLPLLKAGAELGVYTFLGFAFQSIGLESTTASRSAFLLYLNVKIVPFLSAVFYRRAIPLSTWISAFLALCGTCLLSTDGGPFREGDLWCVLAAVSSAMFILRLGDFSARFDPAEINGTSFFTVFLLCALWVGGDMAFHHPMSLVDSSPDLNTISVSSPANMIPQVIQVFLSNPWPVIYLGGITTGLCNYLQTIGQRSISAEKAAIIYSMDPVYGAVFSRVFLNEQLGSQGYLGAGLILAAIYISNTYTSGSGSNSDGGSANGSGSSGSSSSGGSSGGSSSSSSGNSGSSSIYCGRSN